MDSLAQKSTFLIPLTHFSTFFVSNLFSTSWATTAQHSQLVIYDHAPTTQYPDICEYQLYTTEKNCSLYCLINAICLQADLHSHIAMDERFYIKSTKQISQELKEVKIGRNSEFLWFNLFILHTRNEALRRRLLQLRSYSFLLRLRGSRGRHTDLSTSSK